MAVLQQCPRCNKRYSVRRKICSCGFKFSKAPSRVYWIEYYSPDGKRRRERIGPWKKLAEEVLAKRRVEIAENKFLDKVKISNVLFEDFAKKYMKWCYGNNKHPQTKEYRVKLLSKHFGDKLIGDISPFDVEKFKLERKKKVMEGTVNKELTILRHILNKAREWGMLHKENPCSSVKWFRKTPGRLRFLSKEEIVRLLDSCTGYLKDIVQVALNTGMRKGEILNLSLEDVDLDLCLIHVGDSKSGESRDIPINSTLIDVLARLKKNAKGQCLFENPGTCKAFGDVKRSFKNALKEAKIEGATFHTLRHTFASHLVMEGIDLPTVASLLGHKDISMTMRYTHLSPDHRTLAVEKLSSLTGSSPTAISIKANERLLGVLREVH